MNQVQPGDLMFYCLDKKQIMIIAIEPTSPHAYWWNFLDSRTGKIQEYNTLTFALVCE